MSAIVLIRHGETEWSMAHRHTSHTDLELTTGGEAAARSLAPVLARRDFAAVLVSPRRRARRTADLAGLIASDVDDDLAEWDYGDYEGLTAAQIRQQHPDWTLWTDGCPGGESPEQVGVRLDRVLARAHSYLDRGDVALVGHGHALRVAGARWVSLPPAAGALLRLDTATVSELGFEHAGPVILHWNCSEPGSGPG